MGPPSTGRRKAAWAGAALAGLALLGWLLRPESPPPAPERAVQTTLPPLAAAAPPERRPTPPPAVRQEASSAPAPPRDERPPGTTLEEPPDAPPVELPPTTQALAEEFYPGTTDWEDVPVDESHQARLRILPKRYNVVAPLPIAVLLEVMDARGQRQPLSNPHVRVRALEEPSRPWIELSVRDDGAGEDARAGDRQYTATLVPDREQKKQLLGRVLVEGSVDVPGVGTRTLPSVLLYTVGPRAKLTGRWKDSVRAGHLELEAELDVEEAGRFTLMAQVFGPHLEPLAWVKQTEPLASGRRVMTLEVFGKLLHDLGVDGPYRVRQVMLSREHDNSSDYDPGLTLEEAHQTKPYRASDFSPDAYVPPARAVEEVTAEHPSQRDKPPPERTRDTTSGSPAPSPAAAPAAPTPATNLGP